LGSLNRHGITHIESSRQAAEALRPLAGRFAATLFTVGIIGVGVLAIPTLAGSAAYAFAETLGWRQGLDKKARLILWSPETRNEELLADASDTILFDWSHDGQSLLVTQVNKETNLGEIWLQPIAAAPNAQAAGRKIVSDPAYALSEPHFSRDGRWIVFQAMRNLPTKFESSLYVTSASGGSWIPLTDGQHWDDKPRWSPNGRMIYFISGRNGFFNVWGNRFDPVQGKLLGEAFQVTKFIGPALMIPQHIPSVALSVNQNQLVVTMEQVSGSIWMLENVD
jgi:Natural resistance-associated macrophage protein/WD40-like Beta Propeller Repeat